MAVAVPPPPPTIKELEQSIQSFTEEKKRCVAKKEFKLAAQMTTQIRALHVQLELLEQQQLDTSDPANPSSILLPLAVTTGGEEEECKAADDFQSSTTNSETELAGVERLATALKATSGAYDSALMLAASSVETAVLAEEVHAACLSFSLRPSEETQ